MNELKRSAELVPVINPSSGSLRDYANLKGRRVEPRAEAFEAWRSAREGAGLWPYAKYLMASPSATTTLQHSDGGRFTGINFATQDYLSLSTHPEVRAAAVEAIARFGVHSAGSTALAGNVYECLVLEQSIADLLKMEHALLFPTGWAAGFGVIKGLVREHDHVVLDGLAHNCLQEGAMAATRSVHRHRHLDVEHAREKLKAIRDQDSENAILVVTEGVFSMDADSPDIKAFQALCHEFDATLVVDVAHDLGCVGPGGTGQIGVQGMLGQVDVVMGSFSKTFASNGGFVATNNFAVKEYLRYLAPSNIFSNALSPAQIAAVQTAINIIRSAEGEQRRAQLLTVAESTRAVLADHGFNLLGNPHSIVPMVVGDEAVGRRAGLKAAAKGVLINLAEFPVVPVGRARFRLQLMAMHQTDQCRMAANLIAEAVRESEVDVAEALMTSVLKTRSTSQSDAC